MQILQYLINGISIGAVYAIIALGYTMVYGIAKMLNFAHGDVIMVGAYISFCVTNYLGLPAIVSILAAMVVCTVLGIVIEGLAYKPLRGTSSLAVLITAIGVSYFLQNAAQLIWTSNSKNFTSVVTMEPIRLFDGQLLITGEVLLTISVSVLVMIGLTLFTGKTRTGKAMRAVAEDRAAAQLMGINVNRIITITFAIGSSLAALAGLFYLLKAPSVSSTLGAMPGIKAFTAAVIGGIGSIPGAVVGAFIIGLCEEIIKGLGYTTFSDAFTFALLIVVLCVKPTGLFGEKVTDKV